MIASNLERRCFPPPRTTTRMPRGWQITDATGRAAGLFKNEVICRAAHAVVRSVAAATQHMSDLPSWRANNRRAFFWLTADSASNPEALCRFRNGSSGSHAHDLAPRPIHAYVPPARRPLVHLTMRIRRYHAHTPRRQSIIAEQQPARAETRRRWTFAHVDQRTKSPLRHAEGRAISATVKYRGTTMGGAVRHANLRPIRCRVNHHHKPPS